MTTNTDEHNENKKDNYLFDRRIVPIKREGNVVYARTLRRGEEDTGEVVQMEAGDRLVIPPGGLLIDSRDIDDELEEDLGGYKSISPVINIFCACLEGPIEQKKILFAISRWMDSTHLHWKNYTMAVDGMSNAAGLKEKAFFSMAWASAEQAVIMLHRLNQLVARYNKNFGGIKVPGMLKKSSKTVKRLRDNIEHIDEKVFEGTTRLILASREDGSNTLSIAYMPNGGGESFGIDISGIIQPLLDLRESVVDCFGFVKPSAE